MTLTDTADGSRTLYSDTYRQTFHSDKGALAEARHVFLNGAGVPVRLTRGTVQILEVGFGTGLNFFITADEALRCGGVLDYTALERDLLPGTILEMLGYRSHLNHPELFDNYSRFRERLPLLPTPGHYQTALAGGVTLNLVIGDATKQSFDASSFDVIYQDAFSPDANPELWSETFLSQLAHALKPAGVLTTYSVKGDIRRRLTQLGLTVNKRPGPPGGKREMLVAKKAG
jgi:tRNA U34 5-methylaminomethyl-2-thiouridine-forming methyltransferase MnmC